MKNFTKALLVPLVFLLGIGLVQGARIVSTLWDGKQAAGYASLLAEKVSVSQAVLSTPTCTTNCGTSPTVVGTDSAMMVTLGTTPASGFVLNFGGTWTNAPICIAQPALATMTSTKTVMTSVATTTALSVEIIDDTAPSTGDKYAVICFGRE